MDVRKLTASPVVEPKPLIEGYGRGEGNPNDVPLGFDFIIPAMTPKDDPRVAQSMWGGCGTETGVPFGSGYWMEGTCQNR